MITEKKSFIASGQGCEPQSCSLQAGILMTILCRILLSGLEKYFVNFSGYFRIAKKKLFLAPLREANPARPQDRRVY